MKYFKSGGTFKNDNLHNLIYVWFSFFFLIYICGKRNDYSIHGVRVDGYPFVRGLPHSKHKHESPNGPTIYT